MSRVVTRLTLDSERLEALLEPRTQPVLERREPDGRYAAAEGPVRDYRRTVTVAPTSDGHSYVTQTIEYRLAIPYFAWFFWAPFRFAMRQPPWRPQPWWMPPQRFAARDSTVLATLCAVAVVFGYLNTLFSQTIAFAGDEFHASNSAQGVAGALVRAGGVFALVVATLADRRGRRRVILATTVLGCATAAFGAIAPSLPWLTGSQLIARTFATAMVIVVPIMVAEEVPPGSRAFAVGLLAMAAALGAGFCVMALRLADIGLRGWRLVYVLPLLGLLLVPGIARKLPESRRFEAPHPEVAIRGHGRRLILLATAVLLANVFAAPSSQFTNRFLKHERHYSGGAIALLSIGTGTPGVLGIIVGGRLADVRGRRRVAAFSLALGTVCSVVFFFVAGAGLWLWSFLGVVISAAAVPALGVYGPELFPTALRGRTNGLIGIVGLAGSGIGLLTVGALADHWGHIGPAMAVAGIGPLLLAGLVIVAFPETAGQELEELNPEDRNPDDSHPDDRHPDDRRPDDRGTE